MDNNSVFITKQSAKQWIKHWATFPEGIQGHMHLTFGESELKRL